MSYLAAHVRLLLDAVADPDRVGHLADCVVHCKGVDILDTSLLKCSNGARQVEGAVDATVAIRRLGYLASALQNDLALVGEARQRALDKEEHILLAQTKVAEGKSNHPKVVGARCETLVATVSEDRPHRHTHTALTLVPQSRLVWGRPSWGSS